MPGPLQSLVMSLGLDDPAVWQSNSINLNLTGPTVVGGPEPPQLSMEQMQQQLPQSTPEPSFWDQQGAWLSQGNLPRQLGQAYWESGPQQLGQGLRALHQTVQQNAPQGRVTGTQVLPALNTMVRGATTTALPLAYGAGVVQPLATVAGGIVGSALVAGGEHIAKAAGASPAATEMAGNIAGLLPPEHLGMAAMPLVGAMVGEKLIGELAGKFPRLASVIESHLHIAPAQRMGGPDSPLIVSTRVPWAVDAPHAPDATPLFTDLSVVKRDPELLKKFADRIRTYPQLTHAEQAMNDEGVVDAFINRGAKNLDWLWGEMERAHPGTTARAQKWYEGANRLAQETAQQAGVSLEAAGAAHAALSPQKDWYVNAELAKRVMEGWKDFQTSNPVFTQDVFDLYDQTTRRSMQRKMSKITREKGADVARRRWLDMLATLRREKATYVGRAWHDLPPEGQSRLLRTVSEASQAPHYPEILPEGQRGSLFLTGSGEPAKVSWSPYGQIQNVISVLNDDSPANISRILGDEHKVRSFYNNIVDPWHPHSTTMDTHAVAAQHLEPFAQDDRPVKFVMSGPSNATLGISGANPLYNESYRQVATQREVLARAAQSVTWEAERGLFKPSQKNSKLGDIVHQLWLEHSAGQLTDQQLYDAILNEASGIAAPSWHATPRR